MLLHECFADKLKGSVHQDGLAFGSSAMPTSPVMPMRSAMLHVGESTGHLVSGMRSIHTSETGPMAALVTRNEDLQRKIEQVNSNAHPQSKSAYDLFVVERIRHCS